MNKIPSLIRGVGIGAKRLSKSLTFWSIVLGFLLSLEILVISGLYGVWKERGIENAIHSWEYKGTLTLTAVIAMLGVAFYYIERDQNIKAQRETEKILKVIKNNTKELKKLRLTISQSDKQNSSTNTKGKPKKQSIDKNVVTEELNDRTNKPKQQSENDNPSND
jgi:hypothetical protein